jgi:ParB family chromosome partitioning protein
MSTKTAAPVLKTIHLNEIAPHPDNPRKTFDPVKLQELADSIRENGIAQPPTVRPHANGAGTKYQLVIGERRWRASRLAGEVEMPCIVREMDDGMVLEIMTIENLQRDDLHELEEAEGYATLMKVTGATPEEIAGKIGKSKEYVYGRLKLLDLIPESREIFVAGEITAGHAVILARLTREDQLRAIGDPKDPWDSGLFEEYFDDEDDDPALALDDERPKRVAKTVREFGRWVRDEIRLRTDADSLQDLFPETAAAVQGAAAAKLEVVHISYDYSAPDDGGPPVYLNGRWERADGQRDQDDCVSKECGSSVLGVIVIGRDLGQAFKVCVDKKCPVHWKTERASSGGSSKSRKQPSYTTSNAKWEEQRKKAEAERARWKKAAPKLLEELGTKLSTTPALKLADIVVDHCKSHGGLPKGMKRGKTVDDVLRFAAFLVLARSVTYEYGAPEQAPKAFKQVGLDAKKIVNEVAPKPKPEKKPKASAEPKKKGARARRREKAKASA